MTRDELIEAISKAAAISDGWENWETATCVADTLNGNSPDEERARYREWVIDILAAIEAQGMAIVDREKLTAVLDTARADCDISGQDFNHSLEHWQQTEKDRAAIEEIRAMINAGKL